MKCGNSLSWWIVSGEVDMYLSARRAKPLRILMISILSILLPACLSCSDDPVRSPPQGFCWQAVDTLYVSDISVSDTADVRIAFEEYVSLVDSTDATFPGIETDWQYMRSTYVRQYRDRHYWLVQHRSRNPDFPNWMWRQTVYVDENGTVVLPYWCE